MSDETELKLDPEILKHDRSLVTLRKFRLKRVVVIPDGDELCTMWGFD
jgi:hypothetical protein